MAFRYILTYKHDDPMLDVGMKRFQGGCEMGKERWTKGQEEGGKEGTLGPEPPPSGLAEGGTGNYSQRNVFSNLVKVIITLNAVQPILHIFGINLIPSISQYLEILAFLKYLLLGMELQENFGILMKTNREQFFVIITISDQTCPAVSAPAREEYQ